MFNVNYNLRQPKSKEDTPIFAVIRYNKFKLVAPIIKLANKINPKTGLFIATKTIQGHVRTIALLKEFKSNIPFE